MRREVLFVSVFIFCCKVVERGEGNEKNGFLFTMLLFALVGIIMYFQTFKNTRERVVPKNNEVLTLKQSFSALKKIYHGG